MNRVFTFIVLLTALGVTGIEGAPVPLPDAALGSPVLFHLERIAALLSVLIVILVIAQRAARGQLPIELSMQGVKYAPAPPDPDAVQALINDVRLLREALAAVESRLK